MFVSLLYGLGMPILFPFASLNFINQWVCDRYLVAWHMRLPPSLDDSLMINFCHKVKFAPIFLVFNGYWMVSNKQIFENKWSYILDNNESMKSGHTIDLQANYSSPLLDIAFISALLLFFQKVLWDTMIRLNMVEEQRPMEVNENLPNFFESLKLSNCRELLSENENMQSNFGFENTDPDTTDRLLNISMPEKEMQGTPWYQVISNPIYSQAFCYTGPGINDREELIEDGTEREFHYITTTSRDKHGKKITRTRREIKEKCKRIRHEQSDMVMVLLNLSYIPDDVVKNIDFIPGWQQKFHKIMRSYKEYF